MQQLILARCSPRVYCLPQLSQPKRTGITNQSFKAVDYYNFQGKATTKSWRGSINQMVNSVLYNSTGHVFSSPEIKHGLRSQGHQFPSTQLDLPEEQSYQSEAV